MSCLFFRNISPDSDDEFIHAFQQYIIARRKKDLSDLNLTEDEIEYVVDKVYAEEESIGETIRNSRVCIL